MPNEVVNLFTNFLFSQDTFRVYQAGILIFASKKERLAPLLEYISENSQLTTHNSKLDDVVVFDRVVGNAAALLLTKIFCKEVYSDLGSEMAVKTLDAAGIEYHFNRTVDCIKDDAGENMCPMEQLSLNKTPEEFLQVLKSRVSAAKQV